MITDAEEKGLIIPGKVGKIERFGAFPVLRQWNLFGVTNNLHFLEYNCNL